MSTIQNATAAGTAVVTKVTMPALHLALEQNDTAQEHVAIFAGVIGAVYGAMVADLGLEGARAVMATLAERLVLANPTGGLATIAQ